MTYSVRMMILTVAMLLGMGCTPATPPAPTPNASSGGSPSGSVSANSSTTAAAPTPKEDGEAGDAEPKEAAAPEAAAPEAARPAASEPAPAKEDAAASAEPRLQVATWAQAEAIIASHKGKIVVLDFWSNFCPPCLEELPKLGKIHEEFGEQVVCLSFNCNFSGDGKPEDERDAILQVLKPMKAPFLTLISADKDVELYEKLGIASIPVVRVYGRDGKLAKQFDNEKGDYGPDGFTYQKHVHPFVAELVKQ